MGLGKTVMTIALILARPGRGNPDNAPNGFEDERITQKAAETKAQPKPKGGTLIVCPMALLGQWKVIST